MRILSTTFREGSVSVRREDQQTARSRLKGHACSYSNERRGPHSWRRCAASRERNMPDPSTPRNDASRRTRWAREVRTRLSSLGLSPTREADIVDELSQHLDDCWRELVAGGALPDVATRLMLAEFRDGNALARSVAPLGLAHHAVHHAGSPHRTRARRSPAGPALRAPHDGGKTRVHNRRHPLVGSRHRRQHRDIQPVEWRTARVTACGAETRATGDAFQS
jgi:hypothetical protein